MEDQTFRAERRKPTRNMIDQEAPSEVAPALPPGIEIKGNVPAQFAAMLQGAPQTNQSKPKPRQQNPNQDMFETDTKLKDLLQRLAPTTHHYEAVTLPSLGKFYDGSDGPTDGIVYLRPMTGEEEQILATPRYVKRGKALDMIFESCIQGRIDAAKLLSVDRTYLLIYLRGISYTPNYEVEVKCPECSHKYPATISLELDVDNCPEDFGVDNLDDVLPTSKFNFSYRLARGADEAEINQYRERRTKAWGDQAADDTLHYRTALLIQEIEGITDKGQIQQLAKRLPINDLSYIRDLVNNPPFGVDTNIEMICPSCYGEYTIELPMETSFFFPRRKKSN